MHPDHPQNSPSEYLKSVHSFDMNRNSMIESLHLAHFLIKEPVHSLHTSLMGIPKALIQSRHLILVNIQSLGMSLHIMLKSFPSLLYTKISLNNRFKSLLTSLFLYLERGHRLNNLGSWIWRRVVELHLFLQNINKF